jgi:hypothetical protein
METYTMDNISITAKDLIVAGYEKKKQSWSDEEDRKLLRLAGMRLRWIQIA